MIRVAAVQFAVGTDPDANLATCLRMLDEAGARAPDLVVLPEFCNHLSWYDDREHARAMALDLDGPFVAAIAAKAAELRAWVQINVTARRGARVTGTNLVFDRDGTLRATSDKKVLMGAEGDFLDAGDEPPGPVLDTDIGRLGPYACMEGVICELTRCLVLDGAQVLMNSLNSFALDEASLHVPVRAAENRVFVVAANKVGPLIPDAHIAEVAARIKVPAEMLHGAGESQIVAPDGTVLAKAPPSGEAVVVADIEPARADDKRRPDGTDVLAVRRPAVYTPLAAASPPELPSGADEITVAAVSPRATGRAAIAEAAEHVRALATDGVALIVLPELFFADDPADLAEAAARSAEALAAIGEALEGTDARAVLSVATALGDQGVHAAVLVSARGVEARQSAMHASAQLPWASILADGVHIAETPWGRLAMLTAADAIVPEAARLAALARAEVLAIPNRVLEAWETGLGLPERAAENRMNLVAADARASLIAALPPDAMLWAPERVRHFDGRINTPDLARADGSGVLRAALSPARAANRYVSKNTNLVDGRPWQVLGALTR